MTRWFYIARGASLLRWKMRAYDILVILRKEALFHDGLHPTHRLQFRNVRNACHARLVNNCTCTEQSRRRWCKCFNGIRDNDHSMKRGMRDGYFKTLRKALKYLKDVHNVPYRLGSKSLTFAGDVP